MNIIDRWDMDLFQSMYLSELATIHPEEINSRIKELESLLQEACNEKPVDMVIVKGIKGTIEDLIKIRDN